MIRALQRAWEDIRRGENIDLYATVTVAIILAVLNTAGIAPPTWIAPLNLTVLALLAVATLGNRHRLEGILKQMTQGTGSVLLEQFPADTYRNVEKSKELWLVGVTLSSTLEALYPVFESKLRRGDSIKVLLVDPDGAACAMAAMRHYARTDIERQRTEIRTTLRDFCELQRVAPDRLEIRTIDYPLTFGAYAVDPGGTSGVLYLKHYPFKMPLGRARPGLALRPRDERWYEHFRSEIRFLWEQGTGLDARRHDRTDRALAAAAGAGHDARCLAGGADSAHRHHR